MQKERAVALLGGGKLTQSSVARFPALAEQLGPVKAGSLRVASRMVNTLRAGYAVKGYRDLAQCKLLLVSVPDAQLPKTIAELADAEIDWNAKSVVLCDTWLQSGALEPLTQRGASAASLNPVEGFARLFVVEGAGPAVRAVRRLVETQGSRVVEIRGAAKHLYSASQVLSSDLLVPTLWAAMGILRETGVSSNEAARMIEGFFLQSLRGFLKGGRKAWAGPLAARNEGAIQAQIEALEKLNPELARFYRRQARAALELFGVDAEWVGDPES